MSTRRRSSRLNSSNIDSQTDTNRALVLSEVNHKEVHDGGLDILAMTAAESESEHESSSIARTCESNTAKFGQAALSKRAELPRMAEQTGQSENKPQVL